MVPFPIIVRPRARGPYSLPSSLPACFLLKSSVILSRGPLGSSCAQDLLFSTVFDLTDRVVYAIAPSIHSAYQSSEDIDVSPTGPATSWRPLSRIYPPKWCHRAESDSLLSHVRPRARDRAARPPAAGRLPDEGSRRQLHRSDRASHWGTSRSGSRSAFGENGGGSALEVRRIRLLLGEPTRDGDTEIVVLTNLSGEDASAEKVVSSCRRRQAPQRAFQELSDSLETDRHPHRIR